MVICRKCGTENGDGVLLCAVCGNSLEPKKPEKKRIRLPKKWLLLLGAAAVVLLFVLLLIRCTGQKTEPKPDVNLLALTEEYMRYSDAAGAYPPIGLLNENGEVLTSAAYQSVLGEIADDLFAVIGTNGKIGAVNRKGKEIIPCRYDDADLVTGFSGGVWAVQSGDKWGYINRDDEGVIPFAYAEAQGFAQGLAAVSDGRFWGYTDENGNMVIPYRYDEANLFDNGLACVCVDGQYGFIDKTGTAVIAPQFSEAYPYFENGLCLIRYGNRYGFIDKTGEFVINPQFDDALPFSEGLAAVRLEDKIGYIDETGKYVIKPVYDGELTKESLFFNGYAAVYEGETALLLDKNGNKVIGTSYGCTEISHLHNGFAVVCAKGKYGILNPADGTYLLTPTYPRLLFALRNSVAFADTAESVLFSGAGERIKKLDATVYAVDFLSNINKNVRALSLWLER